MPLVHGFSRASVAENIRRLRDEGRPESQSIAIAYREARRAAERAGNQAALARLTRGTDMKRRNSKGQFLKGGQGGGGKRTKHRSTSHALARRAGGDVVVVEQRAPSHHIGGGRGRRAASALLSTTHITGPALMALGLGYAKKEGWEIPVIGELGEDATLAIAGYAALKFKVVPASWRKHVANLTLAALVLTAHEIGQTGDVPGMKKKPKTEGAAGAGSHRPQFKSYEVP